MMIKIKAVVVGILVSAPLCDAFAFAPPSKDVVHTRLTATNNNNNEVQRMVGGAASFLAGLGVAAQMAFADPNILAANAPFDTSSQATTNEIQVKRQLILLTYFFQLDMAAIKVLHLILLTFLSHLTMRQSEANRNQKRKRRPSHLLSLS